MLLNNKEDSYSHYISRSTKNNCKHQLWASQCVQHHMYPAHLFSHLCSFHLWLIIARFCGSHLVSLPNALRQNYRDVCWGPSIKMKVPFSPRLSCPQQYLSGTRATARTIWWRASRRRSRAIWKTRSLTLVSSCRGGWSECPAGRTGRAEMVDVALL